MAHRADSRERQGLSHGIKPEPYAPDPISWISAPSLA